MERLIGEHFGDRSTPEPVGIAELLKRARSGSVTILDTRPLREYEAGHIAGAISMPVDNLQRRLRQLPKDTEYVAYCRGPYCVYADRAVERLIASGRRSYRLVDGFPEWQRAGLPTARGRQAGRLPRRPSAAPRTPHATRQSRRRT